MSYPIDYKNSINSSRLIIYDSKSLIIMEKLLRLIFGFAFLFYSVAMLKNSLEESTNTSYFYFTLFYSISVLTFLIYVTYKFTRLLKFKKIIGQSNYNNRKIAKKVLEKLGWSIVYDTKNYIVINPNESSFALGQQITLIFNKDEILFNSFGYFRNFLKSPISFGKNSANFKKFNEFFESTTSY